MKNKCYHNWEPVAGTMRTYECSICHKCEFAFPEKPVNLLDEFKKLILNADNDDLRTLRAIINGKLSKRKITPEQQAKMQAKRKKKGEGK